MPFVPWILILWVVQTSYKTEAKIVPARFYQAEIVEVQISGPILGSCKFIEISSGLLRASLPPGEMVAKIYRSFPLWGSLGLFSGAFLVSSRLVS